MSIVRVEPVSLVDWPGEICSVVHLKGCNFDCKYCFNRDLIPFDYSRKTDLTELDDVVGDEEIEDNIPGIGIGRVISSIPKNVDRVVITGGEPLAHWYVQRLVYALKDKGYKVGLQTNGSIPVKLSLLLYSLDYVAMDIKGTLDMYNDLVINKALDRNIENKIHDSISLIVESGTDHEFRTTAWPGITKDIIMSIARILLHHGAKMYYLQKYIPQPGVANDDYLDIADLIAISSEVNRIGLDCDIRAS